MKHNKQLELDVYEDQYDSNPTSHSASQRGETRAATPLVDRKPAMTVFIVDDRPDVGVATARSLRSRGYHVEHFVSGVDFLRQEIPSHPSCIVLDLAMPGMNGLEVQGALLKRGDRIPIIFITAHGDTESASQAGKNGAIYFLEKPVQPSDLADLVSDALAQDRLVARKRKEKADIRQRIGTLTKRQFEVLRLVEIGLPNKQIAGRLGIAEATVKIHRREGLNKMDVQCPQDLVRLIRKVGGWERSRQQQDVPDEKE